MKRLLILLLGSCFASTRESCTAQALAQGCDSAAEAFRLGQIERAAAAAEACIASGAGSGDTYKLLALSSFLLGRLDAYRANMERAIEIDPRDAVAHYHLGRFFYESKNLPEAEARFRRALDFDPGHHRAHYFAALCRQGAGDPKGAADEFRKAIAILDRNKVAYGWPFADLGDLLIQQGDYDGGLAWIYRGTRNDPQLPYPHYVYGRALLRRDATPEVEAALSAAIRLDPGYTEAYYLLGRYYTKVDQPEKARAAFARFDELRKTPAASPFGLRR